jgi:hypothetical protein
MTEKAWRLTIAGRPQSFARTITILEVDLRGILRGHDPTSRTGGRGSLSRSGEHFLMRHIPRRQKALRRHLSRPIASDLSQNQRSRLHHALAKQRTRSLSSYIAKITNVKPFGTLHHHLLAPAQARPNHNSEPRKITNFSLLDS